VTSIIVAALTVLGASVGSFLNVVGYRLQRGISMMSPGSQCPSCKRPIRWRHNVPVLGWALLRGRCRDCRHPISLYYPAVEAGTGGLYLAAGLIVAQRHAWSSLPLVLGTLTVAAMVIVVSTGGPGRTVLGAGHPRPTAGRSSDEVAT
jgi:leader peptidase (prepilin peptidase)/N-methyltransferase